MIIAVDHPGGGVGKTTTTLNLAYSLAAAGRQVCVVDIDQQGDLSERLGTAPIAPTLAQVLTTGQGTPAPVRREWDSAGRAPVGFDLVPSSWETMIGMDVTLTGVLNGREQRLKRALARLRPSYDYILIDCPPNLTMLSTNAFYAADTLLVPVQAQPKAYSQLDKLMESVDGPNGVNEYRDTPLGVLGLLLTMTDPYSVTRDVRAALQAHPTYSRLLFQAEIPRRQKATEDRLWQAPVAVYESRDGSAEAYATLAQEVISRAER